MIKTQLIHLILLWALKEVKMVNGKIGGVLFKI